MMMSYHWPGNVRGWKTALSAPSYSAQTESCTAITCSSLQTADATNTPVSGSFEALVRSYEREILVEALKNAKGNMAKAARVLGTTTRILSYRLQS